MILKKIFFVGLLSLSGVCATVHASDLVVTGFGGMSVDNRGAANYSFPIVTPKGRWGLEPSVALAYSSRVGAGIAGIGWDISTGFPRQITRGRSLLARHGVVRGVRFDASDLYYLDGKLLVRVGSGTYGTAGTYRTEIDSHFEVIAAGGSGIDSFEIRYPDGRKAIFGKLGASTDAYQPFFGGAEAYAYAIKRVEDSLGNWMEFNYSVFGGGEYQLSEIRYTGGVGVLPRVSVHFNYETDPASTTRYIYGRYQESTVRLASIVSEVNEGGAIEVSRYNLAYLFDAESNRSRLTSVHPGFRELGGGIKWAPASTVSWSANANKINLVEAPDKPESPSMTFTTTDRLKGDFNGDGRQDFLYYQTGVGLSTLNLIVRSKNPAGGWEDQARSIAYDTDMFLAAVGDFNGDGISDLLIGKRYQGSLGGGWYVSIGARDSFGAPYRISVNYDDYALRNKVNLGSVLIVDLNGDGLDEIMYQEKRQYIIPSFEYSVTMDWVGNLYKVVATDFSFSNTAVVTTALDIKHLSPTINPSGVSFSEENLPSLVPQLGSRGYSFSATDLDGDGRTDLVATNIQIEAQYTADLNVLNYAYALLNVGGGSFVNKGQIYDFVGERLAFMPPPLGHTRLEGDLNGDGLPDIIYLNLGGESRGSSDQGWFVAISRGDGTFDHTLFSGIPLNVTIGESSYPTYYLNPGRFETESYDDHTGDNQEALRHIEGYEITGVCLFDYNGDGRKDFLWHAGSIGWQCALSKGDGFDLANIIAVEGPSSVVTDYYAHLNATWAATNSFNYKISVLDMLGGGRDQLVLTRIPDKRLTGALRSDVTKFAVKGVQSPSGERVEWDLSPISDPSIYTVGSGTAYPIRENRKRLVVSDVWKDNGGNFSEGQRQHFSYQYSGSRTDLSGRGDLGFHSFVTLDHQTNLFKYQFLTQSFPMTGLTHREETYRWLGGTSFNIISSHDNTVVFDKVSTSGGVTLWPFISKAIEYRWEDGAKQFTVGGSGASSRPEELFGVTDRSGAHIVVTAESLFDGQSSIQLTLPGVSGFNPSDLSGATNTVSGTTSFAAFSGLPGAITYGNLKQLSTDFGDGFSETVTTTYKAPVGVLTGLVDTVSTSVTSPAYGTESAPTKSYTYWGSTPLVAGETIDASGTKLDTTTTYARDSKGRVTSTTISGYNSSGDVQHVGSYVVSSTTAFDDRFDLPITTKNADPYLHATTTVYHPFFRVPTSVTDVNGGQVTTAYDALGRATQVTDVLRGLATSTSYTWDASQTVSHSTGLTLTSAYKVTTSATVQPSVTTYYDRLGRPIRTAKEAFGGGLVYTDTVYNALGQVVATTLPYPSAGTKYWATTTYDVLGRVATVTAPSGTVTTNTYIGRATKVSVDAADLGGVDPAAQINTTLVDAKGRTVKVWNADNVPSFSNNLGATGTTASIAFGLDGFGRMRSTTLKDQTQPITATYDALGRQTQLADPDKGTWNYVNNALGQVVQQTDANSNVTTSKFDHLGRPLSRVTIGGGVTETANFYYYDTSDNGSLHLVAKGTKGWIGAPQREEADTVGALGYEAPATINLRYYDDKGRNSLELARTDNTWFYTYTDYDAYSRVNRTRHYWRPADLSDPSGQKPPTVQPYVWESYGYSYAYDTRSYLLSMSDTTSPNRTWWSDPVYDHMDRVTSVKKGNGHTTTRTYRATDGVITAINTGGGQIQDLTYNFDGLGNLTQRVGTGGTENLTYDNLNRLTNSSKQGATTYHANGNINTKRDVLGNTSSAYGYVSAKPHAVESAWGYSMTYDGNGNLLTRSKTGETWSLNWAGFDKPRWMAKTTGSVTAGSEFHYNAKRSRVIQLEFDAMSAGAPSHYTRKRIYGMGSTLEANYKNTAPSGSPDWELDVVRIYVSGPEGTIGTRELSPSKPAADREKVYIYHHDHLGSIDVITPYDSSANIVATDSGGKDGRFSEDAWGQRRDPLTWTGVPTTTDDGGFDSLTPRGFTGHEMLDDLGLVHMNGRIYDPLLGRFLSADVKVDGVLSLQGYNRYSYVANNPLSFIDPSGFAKWELAKKIGRVLVDGGREFKMQRAEMVWKKTSPSEVIKHGADGRAIVGGRSVHLPADAKLGETYSYTNPRTGNTYDVPISKDGFVDFSKHRLDQVDIKMTGDRKLDMKLATEARGSPLPDTHTWHHNQNGTTMEAVPRDLNQMPHTGGDAVARAAIAEATVKSEVSALAVAGGIAAAALAPNSVSAAQGDNPSIARTVGAGAIDALNLVDPGVQDIAQLASTVITGAINLFKDEDKKIEAPSFDLGEWDERMSKDKKK
jgi:RHS repeat-associated protein